MFTIDGSPYPNKIPILNAYTQEHEDLDVFISTRFSKIDSKNIHICCPSYSEFSTVLVSLAIEVYDKIHIINGDYEFSNNTISENTIYTYEWINVARCIINDPRSFAKEYRSMFIEMCNSFGHPQTLDSLLYTIIGDSICVQSPICENSLMAAMSKNA